MASTNGAAAARQPPPQRPSQSLYCSNLNDKLKKPDLRRALYMLFSTYGTVLDVVALKTTKMRGQAHILFRDVQASIQAMRALQGVDFFGKPMKIAYAKAKSDTLAKLDGTYKQPNAASEAVPATNPSIFAGPPGTLPPTTADSQPSGLKRPRDESEEAKEQDDDAPMDMDDDDDAMDQSD